MNGPEPIAIIGMSARVPGADDLDAFWRNLVDGVESVTFETRAEQIARGVPEAVVDDPAYVPAAPVIDQMEGFDAGLFGMTPREAELADPQQRLFLEQAHAALADAGYDPARLDGATGVYAGANADQYQWLNLRRNPRILAAAGELGIAVGNKPDYIATTVSYRLNLRGPSLTVHTACSTSLVALHLAAEALRGGECELALAGGVCIELPHRVGYIGSEGYTSPDGHCRPFDAKANGTIWGSGAAVVVLKRLSDALADGDTVRAVVLGNAVNNDGASKVGFSAPSVDGQIAVITEALEVAGVDPRTIGYVEAHGTGTHLGDPIEVTALSTVYSRASSDKGWCGIGSVKSNIGHLSHAAGLTAVIKSVLAMEHGLIPPTINFESPNPAIDFDDSPFHVVATLSTWDSGRTPRRSAVSSFGIGGTNAHVILQEPPAPAAGPAGTPAGPAGVELVQVSARTPAALGVAVDRLTTRLRAGGLALADVAYTLRAGRAGYQHRAAVVASDVTEAVTALADRKRRLTGDAAAPPRVAMLFSGQGAQYAGMGAGLYADEPVYAAAVDECLNVLRADGVDLRPLLFGRGDAEAEAALTQTRYAQPALFVVEYALARLWRHWGLRPAAMIGHSIGEYVAATLAGVFDLPSALRLVALRGRLMQSMPVGMMLAVQRGEADVAARLPAGVSIAVVNGPGTCVVAGEPDRVAAFAEALRADGIGCTALRNSHAFHSPMMDPILEPFTVAVGQVPLRPPVDGVRLLSNVTGTWATEAQLTDPAYWAAHVRQPVRFGDCVATLVAEGGWQLLECGPGRQLAGLARMQLGKGGPDKGGGPGKGGPGKGGPGKGGPAPLHSLPGPSERTGDLATLLAAAGHLWAAGAPVQAHPDRTGRRVPLPAYPYERTRHWVDPVEHVPAPEKAPAGPRPVERWAEVPVWRQVAPVAPAPLPARAVVFVADAVGAGIAADLRAAGVAVTEVWPRTAAGVPGDIPGDAVTVDPGRREDYEALIAGASGTNSPLWIVQAWATAPAADLGDALDLGFFGLLALAQALLAADTTTRLDVVTAGTQDVTGADLTRPEHATVAGVVRCLPIESTRISARQVDLDPAGIPAGRLVAELGRSDRPLIALRGTRRWAPEYEPVPLTDGADSPLSPGGRYLITGGTGGIGITVAEDFATRTADARIALLSRYGLPPRERWDTHRDGGDRTGRAIAAILRMERRGATVLVLTGDVADPAAMRAAREAVDAAFGGLDGIVHAAGVPGGGMVEVKDRAVAAAVLAPKVAGTLALQAAFGDLPLDFVVLCSSVTAVSGGFGQVDYTAANAFLDAHARAGAGWTGPVVSVNWGGWRDVGMAVETPNPLRAGSGDAATAAEGGGGVRTPLDHPVLRTAARAPEGGGSCLGVVAAATHWLLDEHRLGDEPVLPGTGHLDCVRAAADALLSGTGPVELRDLTFLRPLRVPDGTGAEIRVDVSSGGDVQVFSGGELYVTALAARTTDAEEPAVDLGTVRARLSTVDAERITGGRTSLMRFGPRWDAVREHRAGPGEELALIEAPAAAAGDLTAWPLHPALLDVATSFGRGRGDGSYLPLAYGRVVVRHPLPARFHSHLRYRPDATGGGELIAADVTLADDAGRVLVAVTDFVLRRVDPAAMSAPKSAGTSTPAGPDGGTGSPGITPADGAEALCRVLAADLGPQVVVSAVPLADVIDRERRPLTAGEPSAAASKGGDGDGTATPSGLAAVLAGIWSAVLGVPDVGADDDFFDLGGSSLVAVQLIARIRETVGVRVPMRTLFEATTVAAMAARIEKLRAAARTAEESPAAPDASATSAPPQPTRPPPDGPAIAAIPRLPRSRS